MFYTHGIKVVICTSSLQCNHITSWSYYGNGIYGKSITSIPRLKLLKYELINFLNEHKESIALETIYKKFVSLLFFWRVFKIFIILTICNNNHNGTPLKQMTRVILLLIKLSISLLWSKQKTIEDYAYIISKTNFQWRSLLTTSKYFGYKIYLQVRMHIV